MGVNQRSRKIKSFKPEQDFEPIKNIALLTECGVLWDIVLLQISRLSGVKINR